MKDASDLRSKAKERRRQRIERKNKDFDRVNFPSKEAYERHEKSEMDDEVRVEDQIGKK